ncbi:putative pre-16s rrna nuclease [Fagus crenata]
MGWQQQLPLQVSPFVHYPQFLPPNAHASLPLSSTQTRNYCPRLRAISLHELPPICGFSLGVDLGMSRTSLALSKGFSIRPLTEVDEFIIGLPKSSDGKETPQSNKIHSFAGRFAGWRVYLQDEHGTTTEATDRMICILAGHRSTKSDKEVTRPPLERYNHFHPARRFFIFSTTPSHKTFDLKDAPRGSPKYLSGNDAT